MLTLDREWFYDGKRFKLNCTVGCDPTYVDLVHREYYKHCMEVRSGVLPTEEESRGRDFSRLPIRTVPPGLGVPGAP